MQTQKIVHGYGSKMVAAQRIVNLPLPWANSNMLVYREQLLLWNNWELNEQLLNNKQKKETE